MKLAEKFGRPIITIIDTPGAYPGIDAEERGQAEAIAYNLREMAGLKVPVIAIVLGEGGVISPEGCASILWKDAGQADRAAECLRLTAAELKRFRIIDEIIPEPESWSIATGEDGPSNFESIGHDLQSVLERCLKSLTGLEPAKLRDNRYKKFREMGQWV